MIIAKDKNTFYLLVTVLSFTKSVAGPNEALLTAAKQGKFNAAYEALQAGANSNCYHPVTHETPLVLAVQGNKPTLVVLLLEYKADPNEAGEQDTPLTAAIRAQSVTMTSLLLNNSWKKASPNMPNLANWTPLMTAADEGDNEIIELLLKFGALINIPGLLGETPLIIAIKKEYIATCALLLSKGANPHQNDEIGWSPLTHAACGGQIEVVLMLLEVGAGIPDDILKHLPIPLTPGRSLTRHLLCFLLNKPSPISQGVLDWHLTQLAPDFRERYKKLVYNDTENLSFAADA
jgi:ankyrin repeat protein